MPLETSRQESWARPCYNPIRPKQWSPPPSVLRTRPDCPPPRLFYSFHKPDAEVVAIRDIAQFFPDQDGAAEAFAMFDRDMNGDATRGEIELACMELGRERLSLASSMRDIDSAVGLNNILMSIYTIVVGIGFSVVIDTSTSTLLSGAAAFILALSWLIGPTAQEVLSSVIFLFSLQRSISPILLPPVEAKRRLDLKNCRWTRHLPLTVVSLGESCTLKVVTHYVFTFQCHQTNLVNDEFRIQ